MSEKKQYRECYRFEFDDGKSQYAEQPANTSEFYNPQTREKVILLKHIKFIEHAAVTDLEKKLELRERQLEKIKTYFIEWTCRCNQDYVCEKCETLAYFESMKKEGK